VLVAEEVAELDCEVVAVLVWVTVEATHAIHVTGQSSRTSGNVKHCDSRPMHSRGSALPLQRVSQT